MISYSGGVPVRRPGGQRDNLVEAVVQACREDPVLGAEPGLSSVVVALSGGPDSSALLHALWRASAGLRLSLVAVHVDHGLRPEAAAQAAHAARFAAELQLPVEIVRVAPQGRGEDAARRVRHRALEAVAARLRAPSIALGHTAGDQAETVLLHILRGSGMQGLGAMSRRDGLRFRPLLEVTRDQVQAYCARQALAPVHDASNDDLRFSRNRVRHELIPLLESRFNPRVSEALGRLARVARDEHLVVELAARAWLARQAPEGAIPRREWLLLPAAVQVQVLREAWASVSGAHRLPGGAARIDQALRLARGRRSGMIQLGGGFELHADDRQLQIRPLERPVDRPRSRADLLTEP